MDKMSAHRLLTEATDALLTGQAALALANCELILSQDVFSARAWHLKGKALNALSGAEAALACFDRALQLTPENTECRLDRAIAEKDIGQYQSALKDINLVLDKKPHTEAAKQEKALIRQLQAKDGANSHLRLVKP